MRKYIYFDNAATTVGKPECVIRAVASALDKCGNPGRSGHDFSLNASSEIYACRKAVCRLFGSDCPENVVFTSGATHALNLAIKGIAKKDSHIIISNMEHNSVIRPVHALSMDLSKNISYSVFDAFGSENDILYDFMCKIKSDTRLAVVNLASNVTGKILPVSRIAKLCKAKNIILICDASQCAGCVPVNVKTLGVDVLCFAGHKSLYGPQGVGGAVFCTDCDVESIMEGGNGINTSIREMTGVLPERLEAGTLNTPGICGLAAGISYVSKIGINEIFERNRFLVKTLNEKLSLIKGVSIYGNCDFRAPVLLFNKEGFTSEELAGVLAERRFCVRGGYHCAPLAHKALGTDKSGAVRASLSFNNTPQEIDAFAMAVNSL